MTKYLYGIQPTGRIHLGNYLGGLKLAIEKGAEILVAQLHAMTTIPEEDAYRIGESIQDKWWWNKGKKEHGFYAPLQDEESTLYLAWKIQCLTPVSDLERMTQWKNKGRGNAGLLTYPCLMAADIILSEADVVIVGEDQLQHMEFYRRTCKRLRIKKVAKTLLTETPRIMSIKDPTKKMSKSLGDAHCLYLGDHEANRKKIMKAPSTEIGLKNLENIAKGLGVHFDRKNVLDSKLRIIEAMEKI